MRVIADLQLHSKYARAVSKNMVLPEIAAWARRKGIGLVATGDWTHPLWFREILGNLEEQGNGLLKLKNEDSPLFMLATEVSCIYSQNGKGRRIHTLIWVPSLTSAEKINKEMTRRGCNLMSDGRPIIGLTSIQVAELVLTIEPKAMIIPAHCLLPDSMILCENFVPKKIDSLREGENVLTHEGQLHKITEVKKRRYGGNVLHIQSWYFRPGLVTTPEHPYYAIKTIKKCPTTGDICRPSRAHLAVCKRKDCLRYTPQWIQAKDLEVGDVLVYPRSRIVQTQKETLLNATIGTAMLHAGGKRGRVVKNKVTITPELGRLVGYYLAEGSTDGINSFSFCFSENEQAYIDDVVRLTKYVFGIGHKRIYRRRDSKGVEIVFNSKLHAIWFAQNCYAKSPKRTASYKIIPDFLLTAHDAVQAECLRGWFRGDHGYTTSRILANQMKAICLRLGIIPSIAVDTAANHAARGKHFFNGRQIHANHDTFAFYNFSYFFKDQFDLKKEMPRSQTKLDRKHGWIDEVNAYLPIKEITKQSYDGYVYNLEVEKTHSYVAEFAAVHNCWTPWFSVFGSMSGFDSLEEAYGKFAKNVYAVETGLSSNPAMNWRVKELDTRSVVSFSDAHSGPKLGREATVFDFPQVSYEAVYDAIKNQHIAYTIEFYPEEGKYHWSGHRACNIRWGPKDTAKNGNTCPVCGKPLTQGVEQRVSELAGRSEEDLKLKRDGMMTRSLAFPNRPPFVMLVPLQEIIAECIGSPVASPKVQTPYLQLTDALGGEFNALMHAKHEEIANIAGERVAAGIDKVRAGDLVIDPGYDGVFGVVKLWRDGEEKPLVDASKEQLSIF